MRLIILSFCLAGLLTGCLAGDRVKLGADLLLEQHLSSLKEKRVGLITNHTGRLSNGEYLVDVLLSRGINVVAMFGPEHGIRGEAAAGEKVADAKDVRTGIPVFSLYGSTQKPAPAMLQDLDVLIYDIQDVGARFYTYISTMGLAMEAAAERGIPFIVLDRPNPLGGELVDGPMMEDSLRSFVGMYPLPVVYGLTCGELALMIQGEGWLGKQKGCDLAVIPMEGWRRSMRWKETELRWIPPSPNIPTPHIALIYPATCILEATNVSEGRGTDNPFATIGAPFVDGEILSGAMNGLGLPGVIFHPTSFTPTTSKFKGVRCAGVSIEVNDPSIYEPSLIAFCLLNQLRVLHPDQLTLSRPSFLRLVGSAWVYESVFRGESPEKILPNLRNAVKEYRLRSTRYHLYHDD